MHDHDECEELMNQALAAGKDGYAEYLATRCDINHGQATTGSLREREEAS